MRKAILSLGAALALSLTLLAPLTPQAEAATQEGRLSVQIPGGYSHYFGGQAVVLTGQLPITGVRSVHVESNMNRPSDTWDPADFPGYSTRTKEDGSFRLLIQAPGMFGISYRIASGSYHTPEYLFSASSQEVGITPSTYSPVAGQNFTINVDTTPTLYRRPDLAQAPTLVGRGLTLQEKTSASGWRTLATGVTDGQGEGKFTLSEDSLGDHQYRVREERWREDGSFVGWQASFPLELHVRLATEPATEPPGGTLTPPTSPEREQKAPTASAASAYRWYPLYWDFAWERGEDLTSGPRRGTRMRGHWLGSTTGLGRVSRHNGGLRLDSGLLTKTGRGDRGTTSATLKGNSLTYGRWETRMRLKLNESGGTPYLIRAELVPTKATACSPVITVGEYKSDQGVLTVGATKGHRGWRRSLDAGSLLTNIPALGVEVGKKHLTWFLNGKPIGSVRDERAVPGVPLTLRLSLVGDQSEHTSSTLMSDWQRAFPLDSGTQVKRSHSMQKFSSASCASDAPLGSAG